MARMNDLDDDTEPTAEDGMIAQLRRDGVLGPFHVVDWAGATDEGLVRHRNEDRWRESDGSVFVLADGMGGHEGGSIAAEVASDIAAANAAGMTEASAPELTEVVNAAVVQAGLERSLPQLGTTLVVVSAHSNHVVVLSIGDSRVYRFRDGALEQLTEDHTVRNELIAAGVPLEKAAESKIKLNALTAHIGKQRTGFVPYQVESYSVNDGDRLLLCSDGVHNQVSDADVAAAMCLQPCSASADRLVDLARTAGGRDNATAVVVEFARTETGAAS